MDKVEFLSPQLVDMTRAFLEQQGAKLPTAASGATYVYCASLSDPPAHLDDGTGKVAYWIRVKVPVVEVGTGERDDCGPVNRNDYQASLPHTREHFDFSDPVFVARRQAGQQAQQDAGKPVSEPPPEMLQLLGDLHNYRAALTA